MIAFDGVERYGDVAAKTAAFGFALIHGHLFIDGNKRIRRLRWKYSSF